jgi:predicted short-subunit dehydrogenase-like oxidoreductase (DUF2520 family)
VSAEKEEMKALLVQLAMMINGKVEVISDEQRLCLHLAAVATHNFSNHLMALADAFLAEKNLDYKALLPLMTEMTLKWKEAHPSSIQTGPAVRHDDLVIQKHLELLREYANFSDVYTVLTNSIRKNQSS